MMKDLEKKKSVQQEVDGPFHNQRFMRYSDGFGGLPFTDRHIIRSQDIGDSCVKFYIIKDKLMWIGTDGKR